MYMSNKSSNVLAASKFSFFKNKVCDTLIGFMFFINALYVDVMIFFNFLYKSSPFFKYIADVAKYNNQIIHSILFEYKIEPYNKRWINISYLHADINNIYLNENYDHYYEELIDNTSLLAEQLNNNYQVLNSQSIDYTLLTMTYKDQYIVRSEFLDLQNNNFEKILFNEKVRKPFLQITYTEPNNDKVSIDMNLPESYYLENNELFCATFVKRYLEYQNKPYNFDLDYEIKIMDSDINEFTLSNEDYIVITKDGYEVKSKKK